MSFQGRQLGYWCHLAEAEKFWDGTGFAEEKEHTCSFRCTGKQCQYIHEERESLFICSFIHGASPVAGAGEILWGGLMMTEILFLSLRALGTNISNKRYHVSNLYKRHKQIAHIHSDKSKTTSGWNQSAALQRGGRGRRNTARTFFLGPAPCNLFYLANDLHVYFHLISYPTNSN